MGIARRASVSPAASSSSRRTRKNGVAGPSLTPTQMLAERMLQRAGLGLGDVVMMRVFLVAPQGQQRMDFAGMMRGYQAYFGTPAQPNKPARSTMEVSGLVDPGWLAEIEVTAARK